MNAEMWMCFIGGFLFVQAVMFLQPTERRIWKKAVLTTLLYASVVLLIGGLS